MGPESIPLLLAGLVVDAVSAAILVREYGKLVSKGFAPVMPYSLFHAAIPATKPGLVAALGFYACFAPFEEEAIFRVVPYMLGGLPFAAAATVAWVLAHYHKLYTSNVHLGSEALKSFSAAYLASLALPGAYYAYTVSVDPLVPYLLHAAHNAIVVANLYKMAKPKGKGEGRFLKQPGERKQEERREAGAPAPKPVKPAGPAPARLNRYRLDRYAFAPRLGWVDDWLEAARAERAKGKEI